MNRKVSTARIALLVLLAINQGIVAVDTFGDMKNAAWKSAFALSTKEILVIVASAGTEVNKLSFDAYLIGLKEDIVWTKPKDELAKLETEKAVHKKTEGQAFGDGTANIGVTNDLLINDIVDGKKITLVLRAGGTDNKFFELTKIKLDGSTEVEPVEGADATSEKIDALVSLVKPSDDEKWYKKTWVIVTGVIVVVVLIAVVLAVIFVGKGD